MSTPGNETTAVELAERAKFARPGVIYRAARDGGSVAAWKGRWVVVAARILGGGWASVEMELMIDGKPAWDESQYGPAPYMGEFSGKESWEVRL